VKNCTPNSKSVVHKAVVKLGDQELSRNVNLEEKFDFVSDRDRSNCGDNERSFSLPILSPAAGSPSTFSPSFDGNPSPIAAAGDDTQFRLPPPPSTTVDGELANAPRHQ